MVLESPFLYEAKSGSLREKDYEKSSCDISDEEEISPAEYSSENVLED
jgi:hypothetical protein